MSQWMTSGASRLRSKQNRSFASRAQQRAVASRISTTRSTAGIPSQRQATRKRIAIGETVSSSSKPMYRTGELAQVNGHPQSMPFANEGHPAFNDVDVKRRRIRASSSSMSLLSRHVMDKARRELGLLSPSNVRPMPFHSLAPRTSSGNPFDAALQAIDEVLIRTGKTPTSQRLQANNQYQMNSPPHNEHSSLHIQDSQNQPPLSYSRLAAKRSASCATPPSRFQSNEQTADWESLSSNLLQRQSIRRQGLMLPSRLKSRVTEAEGFVLRSPQTLRSGFVVQRRLNLMDQFRLAAGNMPTPDSCASGNLSRPESYPSRPLKRGSEYSSDSSLSSTSSRKQPRLDGFGLINDRSPDTVPTSSFSLAGVQEQRVGGIERFKTRRVGDAASPRDVPGQISLTKALPSKRKSSVIDVDHLCPRVAPLISLKKRHFQAPALRFFNNGIEVDIHGQSIVDAKQSPEPKGVPLWKNVDNSFSSMYRRINKKDASDRSEVVQETDDLADLKEHQKSIWAQLSADAEGAMSQRKSKLQAQKSPEEPTSSALSSDPSKLASASVDEIVRDSVKEREKALSAASVLMEFMRKTEHVIAQE